MADRQRKVGYAGACTVLAAMMVAACVAFSPPSEAQVPGWQVGPVTIGAHEYDVSTLDPNDRAGLEAFLLHVRSAGDATSLDWLEDPSLGRRLATAFGALLSPDEPTVVTSEAPTNQAAAAVEVFGEDQAGRALWAGYRCKTGVKRVQSGSGAWMLWYYELRVPFCYNGSRIQSAPSGSIRQNAYWGWGYRGSTVERYWYPSPTIYVVTIRGRFTLKSGPVTVNTQTPYVTVHPHADGSVWSKGSCSC